ncbi:hypothetical protein CAOG_01283 [Capsaspora owczarzaki ATCC 30864]|uniref:Integrin beta n=2 Tax=Capsaspora owczarzaki TaxID=192875 RepID=A0A0D2VIQ2_CAPO3|nr:hypothetical protein CAOG_01283 [Capsaspora owczarzaki ATCC 30864]ADI46542.1 integrin beta 1 [Capsaspora owczarzaki]KJE89867.1 hypothetical protein CAOG_001283 [Capsaspora owczarzaki ATCC 30864]|eukprot:XP_004349803.2 hypothetical protein CAOG_01283 [Capsaspora owczarzaki ATCC 30864]
MAAKRVLALLALALLLCLGQARAQTSDPCSAFTICEDCINNAALTMCGWCGDHGQCQSAAGTCSNWQSPASRVLGTSGSTPEVSPTTTNVFLRAGQPLLVTVSVTPQPCKPVDLYLLMDFSGSMDDDLTKVRSLAQPLATKVTQLCTDTSNPTCSNTNCARLGFGSFLEKPAYPMGRWTTSGWIKDSTYTGGTSLPTNHAFRARLPLSYNLGQFVTLVQGISGIQGNIDTPENMIDGMLQAILCQKLIDWPSFNTTYQPRRLMLMLTDDTTHFRKEGYMAGIVEPFPYKCYVPDSAFTLPSTNTNAVNRFIDDASTKYDYPSFSQLKNALIENNIVPIFGSTATGINQRTFQDLVTALGFGQSGTLATNSDNLVQLLSDAYNSIASTIVAAVQSNGNEGFISAISPAAAVGYTNVVVGTTYKFNFTLLYDGTRARTDGNTIIVTFVGFSAVSIVVNLVNDCNCAGLCPVNKCNGHGTCLCGRCTCDDGWTGETCTCNSDPMACPSYNGAVCNGILRGTCQCGTCVCNEGFAGPACECPTTGCPTSTGDVCSGHGTCNCGVCTCDAAWNSTSAIDCSCPTVAPGCMKPSGSGVDCENHGSCKCNQCTCRPGYTGTYCDTPVLPCPNSCSGHGNCTAGSCVCEPGWTGSSCSCSTVCPDNCSGHGTCQCGVCRCQAGYSGLNCACNNNCPSRGGLTCSGHGQCNNCDGTCTCDVGYQSKPDCSCSDAPCPNGCSGHGTCTCGVCTCSGLYTGADCSCWNVGCNSASNCNSALGHGSCNCSQCVCTGNYTPETECLCDRTEHCAGWDGTSECSGHGTCVSDATQCHQCKCDADAQGSPLYSGASCNCSLVECGGETINGFKCNQAAGNGECICGTCHCKNNFTGPSCECGPCSHDCGEHGTCVCGTCVCAPFWGPPGQCTWCDVTAVNNTCPHDSCTNYTSCGSCTDHNDRGCMWCEDLGKCYNNTNGNVKNVCTGTVIRSNGDCPFLGDLPVGTTIGVFVGVFGGIIVAAIAALVALKLINGMRDRREWGKFEAEREKSRWKGDDNPLFKASTTEYSNPLYNDSGK